MWDTLRSGTGDEIFLAEYNSSGVLVWARGAGGPNNIDFGYDIAIDGFGNSYVTGHFHGSALFGAGESNETTLLGTGVEIFVAKYGVVQPDIEVAPGAYDYGDVAVGFSSSQTFSVTNVGTGDLQVSTTEITGAFAGEFSIISGGGAFIVPPLMEHNIVVDFIPNSAGPKSAILRITSDDPDENPLDVLLSGSGVGGPAIADWVALATNSIWLKQGADILSGDVVVNDISPGPFLDSQVELSVGQDVSTPAGFDLKAHRINVKQGATVASDVYYNQLTNNGTITGALNTPLSLPVFSTLPPFQSAPFGAQDIEVAQGDSIALAAGSYRNIVVRSKGKILFTGGIYNVRSIDTRDKTKLLFAASSEVRVSDKFDSDVNAYIGPKSGSGIGASNIIIYVAGINGNNGNLGATPKAAQIGISNIVSANFYVPNGTMWIRQNTDAIGAFLAKDIIVGEGAQISLDSFFDGGSLARVVAENDEGALYTREMFAAPSIPIPTTFSLEQNYPNPFNPETEIRFQLPQASHVVIRIFNIIGEEIRTLIDKEHEVGYFRVHWDGKDRNGNAVAIGVYFYQLRAGSFSQVRKMSLIR